MYGLIFFSALVTNLPLKFKYKTPIEIIVSIALCH